MEVRNATGYLASRIVFYLMNLHTQRRTIYFARAGRSTNTTHKSDEGLSDEGNQYAKLLADALLSFREVEHAKEREQGETPRSLTVPPPQTHPSSPATCILMSSRSGHQPVFIQRRQLCLSRPV